MREEDFVDDIADSIPIMKDTNEEEAESPQFYINTSKKFDFVAGIKKRLGKVEQSDLIKMAEFFELLLEELPSTDTKSIADELRGMNVEIPAESFDFREIQKLYATVHAYKQRITNLVADVSDLWLVLNTASTDIKMIAEGVASGTIQDRKAYASHLVTDFSQRASIVKSTIERLNNKQKLLDQVNYALNAMLKHQEYLSKINQTYMQFGSGVHYEESTDSESSVRKLYNRI